MRFLVVTPPQLGHVRPSLPLARALAALDHRVAWATGADALEHLAGEPFDRLPCGETAAAYKTRLHGRWPDLSDIDPREHGPLTRRRLFEDIVAPAMQGQLEVHIDSWAPDAVLHDPLATAAERACDARGLRRVEHLFGWPLPGRAAAPMRVEIVPASMRNPRHELATQPIECRPAERRPPDVGALPEAVRTLVTQRGLGPLVLVSFGTIFHSRDALRTTAETLASMPVRSVVLGKERAGIGIPASPRQLCVPWLEQSSILPFCSAVVTHGGAGSVLGALAHGCPLLVLPQGADHFRNAEAVHAAGAGLVLGSSPERACLMATLGELLEGTCSAAAESTAESIAAMPAPAIAAARLVAMLQSALPCNTEAEWAVR